jgi:hypothetical protein
VSVRRIIVLLLVFAHLDRCAKTAASFLAGLAPPEQHVEGTIVGAAFAGQDLIVAARRSGVRVFSRIDEQGRATTLATAVVDEPFGEGLSAGGARWWYGTAGLRGRAFGTLFLSGEASAPPVEAFLPLGVHAPFLWLPLEGKQPRGLFVFFRNEQELEVREETPAAEGRRWTFEAPPDYGFGIVWSAEPLAGGRIALVTAEGRPDVEQHLNLRLLGDDGAIVSRTLRAAPRFDHIRTAIDAAGRLAIVTESARAVDVTTIDPTAHGDPSWRRLADAGRHPEVVSTRNGFVAAWLSPGTGTGSSDSGRIRIRELDSRGAALDLFPGNVRAPIVLQRAGDDELLVANGSVLQRVPDDIAAAALLDALHHTAESIAHALDVP